MSRKNSLYVPETSACNSCGEERGEQCTRRVQMSEKKNKGEYKNVDNQENQHSGFRCTIEDKPVEFDNGLEEMKFWKESYDCYDEEAL